MTRGKQIAAVYAASDKYLPGTNCVHKLESKNVRPRFRSRASCAALAQSNLASLDHSLFSSSIVCSTLFSLLGFLLPSLLSLLVSPRASPPDI